MEEMYSVKKRKDNLISLTTNDAAILLAVSQSLPNLPEVAIELVAVRKGIVKEEGIIPKKKDFETYINNERWIRLQSIDERWQRDVLLESKNFSRSNIKFFLKTNFLLVDDVQKSVCIVLCAFSYDEEKYKTPISSEQKFLVKKVAKDIWKQYNINCYSLQYDVRDYDYENTKWEYDRNRSSCTQIKNGKVFEIDKAINTLNMCIPKINEVDLKPLPYDDLPIEAQEAINDLKKIYLNTRLSADALNRLENVFLYNKRRIKKYIMGNSDLSGLKNQIEFLYNDFSKWYDQLICND